MPTITVHTTVTHNGKLYVAGDQYDVDDATAQTLAAFSTRTTEEPPAAPTAKDKKPSEPEK
jgi:hypothetical protein